MLEKRIDFFRPKQLARYIAFFYDRLWITYLDASISENIALTIFPNMIRMVVKSICP